MEEKFELSATSEAFSRCLSDSEVLICEYINAYAQLHKFLSMMGSVFSFVASDVSDKMKILKNWQQSEHGVHYSTVNAMVKHETENKIIKSKGNGCRTLLRLHRALLFLLRLFKDTANAQPSDQMANIAHTAYSETLSQHHTWLIRKAVGLAVYTLPSRSGLLHKMGETSEEEAIKKVHVLVDSMQAVYDQVQEVYEEFDLLNLP